MDGWRDHWWIDGWVDGRGLLVDGRAIDGWTNRQLTNVGWGGRTIAG